MTSTVIPDKPMLNGHNVMKALGRGIFVGIVLAVPFVVAGAFLNLLGLQYSLITSPADMGLLGFFTGIGLEIYPILM
ncbi:MAG: hypothetical protein QXV17_12580 [Candidatus Micrarchaeaceae archaeon]